jgi:hypothetical protein
MTLRALAWWPWISLALVACGSSASTPAPKPPYDGGADAAMGDASQPVEGGAPVDSGATGDASIDGGSPHPGADASSDGAADSGFVPGTPITAAAGQWTWVPFDDAFCGNGAATGIGINPSSTGTRVLIYLEGGGACWDAETCYTLMTSAYFTTGYTQADFTVESTDVTYLALPGGFFDRTAAANPFKDYSYVYVPYCTGDTFAGNNVTTLGTSTAHFVGHANVTAFLDRLVPTFAGADRVILAGSSAGGYGALHNWWQTQQAFGSVRVDLLDDSGTNMPPDVLPVSNATLTAQIAAWNLAATVPPCAACATNPPAIWGFYAQAFPTHRAALLSYTQDSVLPSFMGITTAQFTMGLDELVASDITPNANEKAFLLGAAGHVLFFDPLLTQSGVTVQQFVTQMVTDSAAWATVMP